MNIPRIIPCLLLKGDGLVKGVKFKNHTYIGDPLNAVKIFNDKKVDELFFLDITASSEGRIPRLDLIRDIADECYMPFGVGGGICSIQQIKEIIEAGAEKVSINSAAIENPKLIKEAAAIFGNQSIVVSIDVKKNWRGKYVVMSHSGTKKSKWDLINWVKQTEDMGAGEILINSIANDGTMEGYDLELIKAVSGAVSIPVIATGGAGNMNHLADAVSAGASAVAAGSMFVFTGRHRAVLINYPSIREIEETFI
jgi:cyclase